MTSIILSIGDELTLGQTIDTNSAWLSQQLASLGVAVLSHITVPDDQPSIEQAIVHSAQRCDLLLISGGIGPTEDDLTRQALANVLNQPLELNEQWLKKLESFFQRLGRSMPQSNRIQAMIPRGVTMIDNTNGTAAGMDANYVRPDRQSTCRIFVTPGVPKEMKAMFTNYIRPILERESAGAVILSRTLHTFGLGESSIAEKLGDLMKRGRNPSVGTTVANGIVSLRINSRFPSPEQAEKELETTALACRYALDSLVFGEDDETIQLNVARYLQTGLPALKKGDPPQPFRVKTISTAESCTGGLLAKMLTDIPGSSTYFAQGWVTYSNEAKHDRLGVSENLLNTYGAVSEPVVTAMATAAKRLSKTDYALAISGIAGPSGGTEAKPVGTVCIALASPPHSALSTQDPALITTRTFNFSGDRETIRDRAAKMALSMLRFHLLNKPMPF